MPAFEREEANIRRQYRRTIVVCIALSTLGEAFLFLVHGFILYPQGDILNKFLWAVVYCGLGMGSFLSAFLLLFVVERWQGAKAMLATAGLSLVALGGACNLLCYNLDRHFRYFGGQQSAATFLGNGVGFALLGGLLAGWLLFYPRGNRLLARLRL